MPARPPAPVPTGRSAPQQPASAPSGPGWPRLASRLGVRQRLAALGVVGALMCALPLWQVLRYQGDALSATRAAQEGLDPLAHAVAVQRSLVRHRDVAAEVLRGATTREPERRQRQRIVNDRLTELELALRQHDQPRATLEGEALRADWTALSRRVEERSLAAADSDAGHRLLVEQALQVIDYVSLAGLHLGTQAGAEATAWLQPVLHTLPRLSARLGLLQGATPGSAEAHPREFAATQQRLQQVMTELQALTPPAAAAAPWRDALAALHTRAGDYFELQRHSAPPAELQAAALALAEAEVALHDQARQQLDTALARRAQALAWQRQALLLALGLLAALGTVLGLSLLPPRPPGQGRRSAAPALRRFNAADSGPADTRPADVEAGQPRAAGGPEARRLLQRLRTPGAPPRQASDTLPSHTLPPVD